MTKKFIVGEKYNATQNISFSALSNGYKPFYYSNIIYMGSSDLFEHWFKNGDNDIFFDEDLINNGKAYDNSVVIAKSNQQ